MRSLAFYFDVLVVGLLVVGNSILNQNQSIDRRLNSSNDDSTKSLSSAISGSIYNAGFGNEFLHPLIIYLLVNMITIVSRKGGSIPSFNFIYSNFYLFLLGLADGISMHKTFPVLLNHRRWWLFLNLVLAIFYFTLWMVLLLFVGVLPLLDSVLIGLNRLNQLENNDYSYLQSQLSSIILQCHKLFGFDIITWMNDVFGWPFIYIIAHIIWPLLLAFHFPRLVYEFKPIDSVITPNLVNEMKENEVDAGACDPSEVIFPLLIATNAQSIPKLKNKTIGVMLGRLLGTAIGFYIGIFEVKLCGALIGDVVSKVVIDAIGVLVGAAVGYYVGNLGSRLAKSYSAAPVAANVEKKPIEDVVGIQYNKEFVVVALFGALSMSNAFCDAVGSTVMSLLELSFGLDSELNRIICSAIKCILYSIWAVSMAFLFANKHNLLFCQYLANSISSSKINIDTGDLFPLIYFLLLATKLALYSAVIPLLFGQIASKTEASHPSISQALTLLQHFFSYLFSPSVESLAISWNCIRLYGSSFQKPYNEMVDLIHDRWIYFLGLGFPHIVLPYIANRALTSPFVFTTLFLPRLLFACTVMLSGICNNTNLKDGTSEPHFVSWFSKYERTYSMTSKSNFYFGFNFFDKIYELAIRLNNTIHNKRDQLPGRSCNKRTLMGLLFDAVDLFPNILLSLLVETVGIIIAIVTAILSLASKFVHTMLIVTTGYLFSILSLITDDVARLFRDLREVLSVTSARIKKNVSGGTSPINVNSYKMKTE